ncbi:flagellar basal body L-ring protein FlgH [Silvibacterium sp.]|uniref:flagellar basal body L-ring protein FlgH n=1 Tax=Silvibacterium sp. TaxID=1964179 RepID=UPI0039E67246
MSARGERLSDRSMHAILLTTSLCSILLVAFLPQARGDKTKKNQVAKQTPPDAALSAYIARVRAEQITMVHTPGSLWSADGRLTRLSSDVRAAHIHDPIAIVVSESLTASTDGTVKNSRASNASSAVSQLLGKLSGSSSLNNLLTQTSTSALNAQGQSVTDSSLTTTFGGEVVDELPNGMLVIQAVRQLTFSQQTQTIRLRGLVRPEDISNYNQVTSTSISDLEIEVVGKGIINDYTYRQNPVVRFLQKLLVF